MSEVPLYMAVVSLVISAPPPLKAGGGGSAAGVGGLDVLRETQDVVGRRAVHLRSGFGVRVSCFLFRISCFVFRVWGDGQCTCVRASGLGFRVQPL